MNESLVIDRAKGVVDEGTVSLSVEILMSA